MEQISDINNKLFFIKHYQDMLFFIDDESKEELLSFEYLQIKV